VTVELADRDGAVLEGELLSRHTTLKIGGPARWYCLVQTEEGLSRVLHAASEGGEPLALLGMGSNVLAADEGFPGWVVRLGGDFLRIGVEGDRLIAGGGAALGGACAAAARAGLSGLEPISGIPSSIGGAVRINAGAYGGEIFQVLETVRLVALNGARRESSAAGIPHGYRWTELCDTGEIVAEATLRLRPASREEIEGRTRVVAEKRRGALPGEPNAGSIFKNPPGDYAGRLVEACGLKGTRRGDAEISTRHANVIVNHGRARAADVLELMRLMRDSVSETFGVTLLPEVEFLGLKWD